MELTKVKKQYKKRLGRGLSAGGGKTAGRGTKGQKARAGHNIPRKFEGGQTALSMRLPILPGFKSHKPKAAVVSLDQISSFYKDGETVSAASLAERGIIKFDQRFKILNNGKLTVKVTLDSSIKASAATLQVFKGESVKERSNSAKATPDKKGESTKAVTAEKVETEKLASSNSEKKPAVKAAPAKKPAAKKLASSDSEKPVAKKSAKPAAK